jgi:hypothetical protein
MAYALSYLLSLWERIEVRADRFETRSLTLPKGRGFRIGNARLERFERNVIHFTQFQEF